MVRNVLLVAAKHAFCTLPSQVAVSTLRERHGGLKVYDVLKLSKS